jgi:hypothetical protein
VDLGGAKLEDIRQCLTCHLVFSVLFLFLYRKSWYHENEGSRGLRSARGYRASRLRHMFRRLELFLNCQFIPAWGSIL